MHRFLDLLCAERRRLQLSWLRSDIEVKMHWLPGALQRLWPLELLGAQTHAGQARLNKEPAARVSVNRVT